MNHGKEHEELLLTLMADGRAWSPVELDEAIFGRMQNPFDLGVNDNPFGHALSALMAAGKVKAWTDNDGWHYRIVSGEPRAAPSEKTP